MFHKLMAVCLLLSFAAYAQGVKKNKPAEAPAEKAEKDKADKTEQKENQSEQDRKNIAL